MNQTEIEVLEKTYIVAFKPYTNKQISEAAELWMAEAEYYPPKPRDIISKIQDSVKVKNDEFLKKRYTCARCKQKMSAITSEGICLDCSGVPDISYQFIKSTPTDKKLNYKMEGRIKCNQCGAIGMCIKEPSDSGKWQCRVCYTGMTGTEIAKAWTQLSDMISEP